MMRDKKVVVITGVSTGIGHSLAISYLKLGFKVFGSIRLTTDAADLVAGFPEQFVPIVMDVTDQRSVTQAAEAVHSASPEGIDVLINNAGIAVGGPLLHLPAERMSEQLDVNVTGVLRVCQAFAPMMMGDSHTKKPGRIIQISSVSGKLAMPFIGPYAASKFALEAMSESLRRELLLYGIDVIIVGPGAIKTPIWKKSIQPVETGFTETPYAQAIQQFQKIFVDKAIASGFSPEYFAQKIVDISLSRSPKTRYTFIAKRFTNWVLPRILPARWLDRMFASKLFQTKS